MKKAAYGQNTPVSGDTIPMSPLTGRACPRSAADVGRIARIVAPGWLHHGVQRVRSRIQAGRCGRRGCVAGRTHPRVGVLGQGVGVGVGCAPPFGAHRLCPIACAGRQRGDQHTLPTQRVSGSSTRPQEARPPTEAKEIGIVSSGPTEPVPLLCVGMVWGTGLSFAQRIRTQTLYGTVSEAVGELRNG